MEPATKQRRDSKCGFESVSPRLLIAWLKSPKGQPLMEAIERECLPNLEARLFDGSEEANQLQAKVLERADKTVRAVITVQPTEAGDVDITVFGPHELRARIICLPVVPESVDAHKDIERLIDVELPRNYLAVVWPAWKRARAILCKYYFSFWEWKAVQDKKSVNIAFSEAITEVLGCEKKTPRS